jgi:myo-inositol 2-dehydrogenase/D-chiro-inositol 1-dehydrogenase
MRRHDPGFRRLHEIVRSGELGVLIAIHVADRESWPPDEDPAETGGFVLDVGVHDFDTVRWLSGQEVASVYGTAHATAYPQADLDNAYLVLDLSGGAKATVHQSRTSPVGHDIRCEVVGTQASALLMPEGIKPTLTVLSGDTSGSFPNGFADRWSSAYEEELRDFVRACRKLEDASATLDDDLQAVAIGVAARASVVQGSSFEVGPDWSWEAPSPY